MSHAFREKFKRCYKCIGVEVAHAWDGSERVGAFSIALYDGIYLVRWSAPNREGSALWAAQRPSLIGLIVIQLSARELWDSGYP